MQKELEDTVIYRHYKGNLYIVLDWGLKNSETGELEFSYKNIITQENYVRPQSMFDEVVDGGKSRFEMTSAMTYRTYLTAFLTADTASYVEEENKTGFFYDILQGEGWVPYNQLSLKQLEEEYQCITLEMDPFKIPPYVFEKYPSLSNHLERLLDPLAIYLLKEVKST